MNMFLILRIQNYLEMLNKYFTYENFEVSLNRPELLLVKEFEDLMSKDFNKCKENPKGDKKIKALKVMKYLFLAYDHSSPYSEENSETRKFNALRDSGLEARDLQDKIVLNASIKYEVLTKTRLSKMLEAAQSAVDKFTLYFHNVDYTEIDFETGKAKYNIKDGIAAVSNLGKLVDGLKVLQEQVRLESEAESSIRGGVEAGWLD